MLGRSLTIPSPFPSVAVLVRQAAA